MTSVLIDGPMSTPTFTLIKVKPDQGEDRIVVDYLRRPEEIYGYQVSDYSTNPDEVVGYEEGEAVITVRISGNSLPDPIVFGNMIREFFIGTGFMWTSDFEQDVLAEVSSVVEI